MKRSRVVIITRGDLPLIWAYDGDCGEIPVIEVPKKQIVDTNGAGDAFYGGNSLKDCF